MRMLTDLHGVELRSVVLAAAAMLSLAGCATGQAAEAPASVGKRREVIEKQTQAKAPTRAAVTAAASNIAEVPVAIRHLFIDDLMRRALVRREAITVLEGEQHEWPDGSLGCAVPGMNYMQVVTPGYRVKLSANGQSYWYHSDLKGRFVVCDRGVPAAPAKRSGSDEPPAE